MPKISPDTSVTYLIIGAGPAGLGALHRLRELDESSILCVERNPHAGGLAASFTDDAGFTWDIGGHVAFSHYTYYDDLLDSLLGDEVLRHLRISRVRMADTWVPYPFQNNIRYLPKELAWECIEGLLPGKRSEEKPANFQQWFERVFGAGITRLFMAPYNYKVWATPPELMAYQWIGERVSVVDLERTVRNVVLGTDDVAWGPNNTFLFPEHGGTGEIYRRLAARHEDFIRYQTAVVSIDADTRTARLSDGTTVQYEKLLTTMPLDLLAREVITQTPDGLREAALDLKHSATLVVGVGVEGPVPAGVHGATPDDTCWMYFPEDDCPFYRVTNFHNYSPNHVPVPGTQRALMAEVSMSEHKVEDVDSLMDATLQGLINTTLMSEGDRPQVKSRWQHVEEYGYPTPTLGRDGALAAIQPWLEERDVYSRGRFGGWKYEAANMDHSVMQGVEWANRMVTGEAESTYSF